MAGSDYLYIGKATRVENIISDLTPPRYIIGSTAVGMLYYVLSEEDGWSSIRVGNKIGYVPADSLEEADIDTTPKISLTVSQPEPTRIGLTLRAGQNIPVPVDATLSIAGEAADAKATGDAIALARTEASNATNQLREDAVLKTMVDDTLSATGYAADAKATGDAIQAVSRDLSDLAADAVTKDMIDTTLSVTGNAAESKSVGDAISSLRNEAVLKTDIDIAAITTEQIDNMMEGWDDGDT